MYPGFRFIDVKIYIDTPDQAFAEYTIHQKSGISWLLDTAAEKTFGLGGQSDGDPHGFIRRMLLGPIVDP